MKETMLSTVSSGAVLGSSSAPSLAGTRGRRCLGRRHGRSFIRPSLRYAAAKGWSHVKETVLATVFPVLLCDPLRRSHRRKRRLSSSILQNELNKFCKPDFLTYICIALRKSGV